MLKKIESDYGITPVASFDLVNRSTSTSLVKKQLIEVVGPSTSVINACKKLATLVPYYSACLVQYSYSMHYPFI